MQILSNTITIKAKFPIDNNYIEEQILKKIGVKPLRWAIVNVNCDTLDICVANEVL